MPARGRVSRADVAVAASGAERAAGRDALVLAFHSEPQWQAALPDPARRCSVLRAGIDALLSAGTQNVSLTVARRSGDVVGAAVAWVPGYHPSPVAVFRRLAAGAVIAYNARLATLALMRRWLVMRRADPTDRPHWHLAAIGVRPQSQGRGVGSALLNELLVQVDRSREPVYLETSRGELVDWYRRFGFRVRRTLALPHSGSGWTMWRPSQTPSQTFAAWSSKPAESKEPSPDFSVRLGSSGVPGDGLRS